MTHTTPFPGDHAPDLAFATLGSADFDLGTARPESFSLVLFYRGSHCPICKSQLEELNDKLGGFAEIGVDVYVISMDDEARARKQRRDWSIDNLSIGYGLSEEAAREWGLFISSGAKEGEPARFSEPGLAVVRPDGTMYALHLQNVPFARPTSDGLRQGLAFILEKHYPLRGTSRRDRSREPSRRGFLVTASDAIVAGCVAPDAHGVERRAATLTRPEI